MIFLTVFYGHEKKLPKLNNFYEMITTLKLAKKNLTSLYKLYTILWKII